MKPNLKAEGFLASALNHPLGNLASRKQTPPFTNPAAHRLGPPLSPFEGEWVPENTYFYQFGNFSMEIGILFSY